MSVHNATSKGNSWSCSAAWCLGQVVHRRDHQSPFPGNPFMTWENQPHFSKVILFYIPDITQIIIKYPQYLPYIPHTVFPKYIFEKCTSPQNIHGKYQPKILEIKIKQQMLSISVYIYPSLSISTYIYLCLSISVYICLCLSISIYIYLYLSMSIYIYLYIYLDLSISIPMYLHLSPCISIYLYLYLSLSIYIYFFLSLSFYIYLYLSISIYIYLYLSVI